MSPSKSHYFVAAALLLFIYIGGYFGARSSHFLIHRVTHQSNGVSTHFYHSVIKGDLGPGMSIHPAEVALQTTAYYAFSPLRWLETAYWYFRALSL